MGLKEHLLRRKLNRLKERGDEQSLKHVNLRGHRFCFRRSSEVWHAYEEIFRGGMYTFPAAGETPFIIDCGAHIGMSVIFFKQLYPNSRVLAFEPDTESFGLLQENCRGLRNVTLEQKAVWVDNDGVYFEQRGDMSSHIVSGANGAPAATLVPSTRLRDHLTQPVDLLKIDIEGAEIAVLQDCKDRLQLVKNMFVEFHGRAHDPEKLQTLLSIFSECNLNYYIKQANDWAEAPFMNLEYIDMQQVYQWQVQLNIFCKSKGT